MLQSYKMLWENPNNFVILAQLNLSQYPNIAAGVIPKVEQSRRAIFNVGSALPET